MKNRFRKLLVCLLCSMVLSNLAAQDLVEVKGERNSHDNSVMLRYKKKIPGACTVYVVFTEIGNTHASDIIRVVRDDSGVLCRLTPIEKKKPIRYAFRCRSVAGVVNPKVDSLFVYSLPFPAGTSVLVRENRHAREKYLGHELPDESGWRSFAFYTETNDTVCAARRGVVVELADIHEEDSLKLTKYTSRRNRIVVEHADGTRARYSNLDKDHIFVEEGQEVYPQTPLGKVHESTNVDRYYLAFSVSYMKQKNPERKPIRCYMKPMFLTEKGEIYLEKDEEYVVTIHDK